MTQFHILNSHSTLSSGLITFLRQNDGRPQE